MLLILLLLTGLTPLDLAEAKGHESSVDILKPLTSEVDVAALFGTDTSLLFRDTEGQAEFIPADEMTPLKERSLKLNYVFRGGKEGLGYYQVSGHTRWDEHSVGYTRRSPCSKLWKSRQCLWSLSSRCSSFHLKLDEAYGSLLPG